MKTTKNYKLFAGMTALALTVTGLTFAGASQQRMKWSSPGNCGIPRSGYETKTLRQSSYLTMPATGATYTNVFYSVSPDTQVSNPDYVALSARIRKAGADERIKVYLKEFRHDNGLIYTRQLMDSANSPISTGAQLLNDWEPAPGWGFQDPDSVFFIEVRMYKSATGGAPRLYTLRLNGDLG